MISNILSLKSYHAVIEDETTLLPTFRGAEPRQIHNTEVIDFRSPNLFDLSFQGTVSGSFISDGKSVYLYSGLTQEYAVGPAPKNVLESALSLPIGGTVHWRSVSTISFAGDRAYALIGSADGSMRTATVKLVIGHGYLPLRIVVSLPVMSTPTGNGLKITRTETFSQPRINAGLPTDLFHFTPPAGATKVGSISYLKNELMDGGSY